MPKSTKTQKPTAEVVDLMPQWQRSEVTYLAGRSAIDTADIIALDCERRWGVGRLRLLVDEETRTKFDSQRLKLNHAIRHGDLESVRTQSARMANAWRFLDNVARETGAALLAPEVWEIARSDGRVVAIVRTMADAVGVVASGRYVEVYDLQEIGHLIQGFPALARAKEVFPGAEVTAVRPIIRDPIEAWEEDGDEIPFEAA